MRIGKSSAERFSLAVPLGTNRSVERRSTHRIFVEHSNTRRAHPLSLACSLWNPSPATGDHPHPLRHSSTIRTLRRAMWKLCNLRRQLCTSGGTAGGGSLHGLTVCLCLERCYCLQSARRILQWPAPIAVKLEEQHFRENSLIDADAVGTGNGHSDGDSVHEAFYKAWIALRLRAALNYLLDRLTEST
jgi:hypothetical protein